jgi:predicted MFS family arabinose efflux permease
MTRERSPGLMLALLLAAYTLNFIDRTIINIVQQPMKEELGLSDTQLGLLGGTAFSLFYSVLGIPIARLAERRSRPGIIAAAIGTWSLFTAGCGAAGSFAQLFLLRMGVGVGEAGGTPPSHALIADMYPPDRRATAIGIYSLGVPLGILLGAVAGGMAAQWLGWRLAFVAAGLPGLILAPAVLLLIREPRATATHREDVLPSLGAAARRLCRIPSFVHLAAGIVIASTAGYALLAFTATLLVRRFGMDLAEAGFATGIVTGLAAGIGTFAGGVLADRLGRRNPRYQMRVPAIGVALAALLFMLGYQAPAGIAMLTLLFAAGMFQFLYLGPTYAVAQSLAPQSMRATASALLLLVVNLIGLGVGPPLLGWASDRFMAATGDSAASLAMAMALMATLFLWSAAHYWRASQHLPRDLAMAGAA